MAANKARFALVGLFGVNAVGIFLGLSAVPFACLNFALLTVGVYFRRTPSRHAPLMAAGIGGDLGVVIALQLQKSVIQTALEKPLGLLGNIHVGTSITAALCYPLMLYVGFGLLSGRLGGTWALRHRLAGMVTYGFRSVGFVTMFWM